MLAAVAAAGFVLLLRRLHLLDGAPAMVLSLLLMVVIPSAATLSGRLVVNGSVLLGWVPLLWWTALPLGDIGRIGLLLALAVGSLTAWILAGPAPRTRVRRLAPRVAAVDLMPAAAALIAAWTTWPLLTSTSADRTLSALMRLGWDHCAHFGMVMLARSEGAVSAMLGPAPDGTPWVGSDYPQHFHATMSALAELISGPGAGDPAAELVRYGRDAALLQVLTVVLLTAGLAHLPALRRRPAVAWPLAAAVVAAFLFGPGAVALASGWGNFVLACAAAALALLLAVSMTGRWTPWNALVLGGLVVATVHGWALLAPLAAAAVLVALVPFRRSRLPASGSRSATIALVVVIVLAASAVVAPMLLGGGGASLLTVGGSFPVSLAQLLVVSLAAMAAGLTAFLLRRGTDDGAKGLALLAVPGTGLALLGLLAAYLAGTPAGLTYYFSKLALGATLIGVVAAAAAIATCFGDASAEDERTADEMGAAGVRAAAETGTRRSRRRKTVVAAASALATLAALQLFGYVGPLLPIDGLVRADGLEYRDAARAAMDDPDPAAVRALRAADVARTKPFGTAVYVAAAPGDPHPRLAFFWQAALAAAWTEQSAADAQVLSTRSAFSDARETADAARVILEQDPSLTVIVAPELAPDVRAALPDDLSGRVLAW